MLDVVKEIGPQLNIALGDFAYTPGIEQQFCDMVTDALGTALSYQLIAGSHESNGRDGDIQDFAWCLPISFLASRAPAEHSGTSTYPRKIRSFALPWFPRASISQAGSRWTTHPTATSGAGQPGPSTGRRRKHSLDSSGNARALPQLGKGGGTVLVTAGVGGVGMYDVYDNDPEAGFFAAVSGKNRSPAEGTGDATATEERLDVRFVPAACYSFTDAFTIGDAKSGARGRPSPAVTGAVVRAAESVPSPEPAACLGQPEPVCQGPVRRCPQGSNSPAHGAGNARRRRART